MTAKRRIESRLRVMRLRRGWSQIRLAGLAGVSVEAVRYGERGDVLRLTVEQCLRMANELDASVSEVWPLLGPMPEMEAKRVDRGLRVRMAELERIRAERAAPLLEVERDSA